MTVRLSLDDGRTWSASRVVNAGPSGYSSLTMLDNRTAGLLYERGEKNPYAQIVFQRFDLAWVQQGDHE